jgi:anti-sigma factor RsiW
VNTNGDMRHLTSEDIQDLLDQELSPSEDARVREHLSSCVRCRSEMEAWSLLFGELGSLPDLAPGPAFSRAVLERLSVREPVGARVRGWLAARVPGAGRHRTRLSRGHPGLPGPAPPRSQKGPGWKPTWPPALHAVVR